MRRIKKLTNHFAVTHSCRDIGEPLEGNRPQHGGVLQGVKGWVSAFRGLQHSGPCNLSPPAYSPQYRTAPPDCWMQPALSSGLSCGPTLEGSLMSLPVKLNFSGSVMTVRICSRLGERRPALSRCHLHSFQCIH